MVRCVALIFYTAGRCVRVQSDKQTHTRLNRFFALTREKPCAPVYNAASAEYERVADPNIKQEEKRWDSNRQ